jgi:hypothetical protein
MYGTKNQAVALWKGTYNTEFEMVWQQIYEKIGLEPRFGSWFQNRIKAFEFTHGGKEQLVRQASGSDIISSYTDDEVRSLVRETMPIANLSLRGQMEGEQLSSVDDEYCHSHSEYLQRATNA